MVYQFVVTLKNTRARYIDRLSLLLLFISLISFLVQAAGIHERFRYVFLFCAVFITGIILYNILTQKRQPGKNIFYRPALYIAAIGWAAMPENKWVFAPFVIMALFEHMAKKPLEIGFSDETVVINTLFRRKYRWTDFNNIIIKDDLLTLDFKNNRLLQRETIDEEGDAEEDEFNIYCRDRLAKAHAIIS